MKKYAQLLAVGLASSVLLATAATESLGASNGGIIGTAIDARGVLLIHATALTPELSDFILDDQTHHAVFLITEDMHVHSRQASTIETLSYRLFVETHLPTLEQPLTIQSGASPRLDSIRQFVEAQPDRAPPPEPVAIPVSEPPDAAPASTRKPGDALLEAFGHPTDVRTMAMTNWGVLFIELGSPPSNPRETLQAALDGERGLGIVGVVMITADGYVSANLEGYVRTMTWHEFETQIGMTPAHKLNLWGLTFLDGWGEGEHLQNRHLDRPGLGFAARSSVGGLSSAQANSCTTTVTSTASSVICYDTRGRVTYRLECTTSTFGGTHQSTCTRRLR